MKKFFIGLIVSIFVTFNLYAGDVNEARAKAYITARYLQSEGYTIGALKGKYLGNGRSVTYSRYLYAGNRYVIIGAGDSTVRDLDIMVYDKNWK